MLRVYSQVTLIRYLSRTERGPATISRAMLSAQQVLHDYLLNEWAKKKNTLAGKLLFLRCVLCARYCARVFNK